MTRQAPIVLAALCLAFVTFVSLPALAVVTVTNTNDSGPGSLRQAILDGAGQNIDFHPSLYGSTIALTSGELLVAAPMTINGAGARITVSGNKASRVFHVTGIGVTIRGITIRDGLVVATGGGGVYNQGNLQLIEAWVTENTSTAGGGGIRNDATLSLLRSTVSGNVASASFGGGIDNVFNASLTLTSSTVSGNLAGIGGGIDNYGGTSTNVSAIYSTIAFNRSTSSGAGGIHAADGPASLVTLQGTILANNSGPGTADCDGTLASADYNLVGSLTGCALSGVTTHNVVGQDPLLGSLQTNGAEPKTHALRPGSPAMDVVPSATCTATVTLDQRSFPRPQDGTPTGTAACDIGAYEARTPIVVNSLLDTADPGKCRLRDAIAAANTNAVVNGCAAGSGPAQDRIVFSVTGRIRLDGAALVATDGVMVDGPGATKLTVSGERASGVYEPQDGTTSSFHGLAGVTIANGRRDFGAGVFFAFGDDVLSIDRVAFEDNVATSNAGALNAFLERRLEVDATSFSNTLAQSAFDGIIVNSMPGYFTNVTVGETRSTEAALIAWSNSQPAFLRLVNCTIRGREPKGVLASGATAVVEYRNSVFAGHGTELSANAGTFVSGGYNVIADGSGAAAATGDAKNADPKLGSHLYGGGPTRTMAPLVGSPAIDRVPIPACLATVDQRGVPRPIDGDRTNGATCDSGAFETAPPIVVNSLLDTTDAGKCRLRDAIAAANTNAAVNGCPAGLAEAPDLITFSVTGTIPLGAQLKPTSSLAIRGPGADKLTISGQGARTVFDLGGVPGDYTFTGMTVADGQASQPQGGGFFVYSVGSIAIGESVLRNNRSSTDGGAFFASDTAMQIHRSTVTTTGTSQNELCNVFNGSLLVEDSTLSNSTGTHTLAITAQGAGANAYMLLKNVTINGTSPGGILVRTLSGPAASASVAEYAATIVNGHATAFDLNSGTGVSLGDNISSDATGNLTATGDKPNTDALLGPLGYHGGAMPVFDLKPASPAKDAIPLARCGQAVDQRGFARPFGAACDIGAVERVIGGDVDGNGSVNVADVFYLINYLFAGGPVPMGEGDVNGDAALNVADVFYLINRLFAGGAAPI